MALSHLNWDVQLPESDCVTLWDKRGVSCLSVEFADGIREKNIFKK